MIKDGQEQRLEEPAARAAGLTLVDLSDRFSPYIFSEGQAENGTLLGNRYRAIFLGLAGDLTDADGQPLVSEKQRAKDPSSQPHNYLELYGIPPTLSVLRARFLEDESRCSDVDFSKIRAVTIIPSKFPLKDPVALAAFEEIEKRLRCEGLLAPRARHLPGRFDDALREALVRFQHKNKIYDGAAFRKETVAALGRTLLENDHQALVRVVTERAVAAADVLEDGTTEATYLDAHGQKQSLRNLAAEASQAALQQLGLDSPALALTFFKRHPAADFATLRAGVRFAPPPEYYAPHMDLSVEIDRGDVIYDPLFDEHGKPNNQTRHHFPSLTVRVRYHDQQIPLVRWRTTIGGWRSDLASNGYEYFRYKGSDVGPRVWRNIVAGPVWIAPNSTPVRTLVKVKNVRGMNQLVVNYDEVGPGYLSAYGLVAAYNVVPGKEGKPDWDNGVRVHGSSEYRSMFNPDGYSHGCHRLVNHLAERLFSFILRHRTMRVEGDQPLGFSRQFLWKDDVYEMRLPTRGYRYLLDPPLPVTVLEGNILGKLKKPMAGYAPKPGVDYPPGPMPVPPDSPEARAAGTAREEEEE